MPETRAEAPPLEAPIDCRQTVEEHLADRYVLGQLTPEDAAVFEDHYMECQACVAEVERAELLVAGLKRLAAEGLTERSEGQKQPVAAEEAGQLVEFRPPPRRATARRLGGWLAAAFAGAALTLALGGGRGGTESVDDPASVAVFNLQPERSATGEPGRRVERTGLPVILALELSEPFYGSYRARLVRDRHVLWQVQNLTLGERGTLHLRVPGQGLADGAYLLELEAEVDGEWAAVGRFTFRLEGG